MRFYLSGGMEFKTNLGVEWRQMLTKQLQELGHETVDPTKLEEDNNLKGPVQYHLTDLKITGELEEVRRITRNTLFRKDMYGIQLSDALVILYDPSVQKGAGTLAETWEAFREGRPIYGVSTLPIAEVPTWLIGETTELFFNFEDFLTYVSNPVSLEQDLISAVKIRDEILGGLYKER